MVLPVPQAHRVRLDLPDLRVARVLADPLALLVLAGQPAPLAMRQLLQAQPAPPGLLVLMA